MNLKALNASQFTTLLAQLGRAPQPRPTLWLYTDATLLSDGSAGFGASLRLAHGDEIATTSERGGPFQSSAAAEYEAAIVLHTDCNDIPGRILSTKGGLHRRMPELRAALDLIGPWTAVWIPRRQNWRADLLADLALRDGMPEIVRKAILAPCPAAALDDNLNAYWKALRKIGIAITTPRMKPAPLAKAKTKKPLPPSRPTPGAQRVPFDVARKVIEDGGDFARCTSFVEADEDRYAG